MREEDSRDQRILLGKWEKREEADMCKEGGKYRAKGSKRNFKKPRTQVSLCVNIIYS